MLLNLIFISELSVSSKKRNVFSLILIVKKGKNFYRKMEKAYTSELIGRRKMKTIAKKGEMVADKRQSLEALPLWSTTMAKRNKNIKS